MTNEQRANYIADKLSILEDISAILIEGLEQENDNNISIELRDFNQRLSSLSKEAKILSRIVKEYPRN